MATQQVVTSAAPWKSLLQRSLTQNSNLPYSKYMQLASTRQDGRPAVRTVVFRGFLAGTDHLTFVTDRRSRKVHELSANPHVEVCWYFPSSREQYRLSGTATIVQLDHSDEQLLQSRQQAWAAMSDAGRSQFLWPEPGQPRMPMDEALFLVPAPNSAGPAVDNFCLGVIYVNEVDHVDLFSNKRAVYTSSTSSSSSSSQQEGTNAEPLPAAPAAAAAAAGGVVQEERCWVVDHVNP